MLRLTTRWSRWAFGLLVAVVAISVSVGSASAAPRTPNRDNRERVRLERAYNEEQARLKAQEAWLKRANEFSTKVNTRIAELKNRGEETATLEQALAAFNGGIAQARDHWNLANGTLATHAGFDAQGNVTNVDQARATIQAARQHLQQARQVARAAMLQLRAAFAKYRQAHPRTPLPEPPAISS